MVKNIERFTYEQEVMAKDPHHAQGFRRLREFAQYLGRSGELPEGVEVGIDAIGPAFFEPLEDTPVFIHPYFIYSQQDSIIMVNDRIIELSKTENKLLATFTQFPNRILPREYLLRTVWEKPYDVQTKTVDVYVGYVRKKIDDGRDLGTNEVIETRRGIGYRLNAPAQDKNKSI